jgi:dipeptidyl aminopeptidase/acylaminoacyl peptidase
MGVVQLKIPKALITIVTIAMKGQVFKHTKIKLDDIKPIAFAPKCITPALFVHGIRDDFVTKEHTEKNFAAYGGPKEVLYFEGTHNGERPIAVME